MFLAKYMFCYKTLYPVQTVENMFLKYYCYLSFIESYTFTRREMNRKAIKCGTLAVYVHCECRSFKNNVSNYVEHVGAKIRGLDFEELYHLEPLLQCLAIGTDYGISVI